MYTTDFAYDGPIFLVPLSPSYPSSPVSIVKLGYSLATPSGQLSVCDLPNVGREDFLSVEDDDDECGGEREFPCHGHPSS